MYFTCLIFKIIRFAQRTKDKYDNTEYLTGTEVCTSFRCGIKVEGNAQESIQSNSTSCPKHQTGKEHVQLKRHKINKPIGQLSPSRRPQSYPY